MPPDANFHPNFFSLYRKALSAFWLKIASSF